MKSAWTVPPVILILHNMHTMPHIYYTTHIQNSITWNSEIWPTLNLLEKSFKSSITCSSINTDIARQSQFPPTLCTLFIRTVHYMYFYYNHKQGVYKFGKIKFRVFQVYNKSSFPDNYKLKTWLLQISLKVNLTLFLQFYMILFKSYEWKCRWFSIISPHWLI